MSVIMEKDDRVFVYCKGADNAIFARLKEDNNNVGRTVEENIEKWSRQGLRTLLFAKRQIDKRDYLKWAKMYAWSLSNLEKKEKTEKIKLKTQLQRKISARSMSERNSVEGFEGLTRMIIEDESLSQ